MPLRIACNLDIIHNPESIPALEELYKQGHKVILYTASKEFYSDLFQNLIDLKVKFFDLYQGDSENLAAFVQWLNPELVIETDGSIAESIDRLRINTVLIGSESEIVPSRNDWNQLLEYVSELDEEIHIIRLATDQPM